MIALGLRNYNEIYERAQVIEQDMMERTAASGSRFISGRNNKSFGKRPMMDSRRFVPPARRELRKPSVVSNVACNACGRRHGNSPCAVRTGACFGCG